MWCVAIILALPVLLYLWLYYRFNYWIKVGVPQERPNEIIKDLLLFVLKKTRTIDSLKKGYDLYAGKRYLGIYGPINPALFVKDPDLIKQITVKDFDHFTDHDSLLSEDLDPLWAKNLFSLRGQKWRDMRSTLSPAFTSSKMKIMFELISQSGRQFVDYFLEKNETKITSIDCKDIFSRFTNDVIASTAFGTKCDSLKERDNEFYMMGKDATDFTNFNKGFRILLFLFFPKISKLTGTTLFSKAVRNFFTQLIRDNIETRERNNIVRPDMIQLLMEARKNGLQYEEGLVTREGFAATEESEIGKVQKRQKTPISDEDITAQALLFFFAGFETVSSQMCFVAYELAINPEIQDKLRQEIDEVDVLTYDGLSKMHYLDMVISESLRKWPAAIIADRLCTKAYTIEAKNDTEVPIDLKENFRIFIPIYNIHRDPKYYPDPERFDPERFNEENKIHLKPFTYMPFGLGPRSCIGSRFALLEIKALFFHIIKNFEIVPVKETEIPITISNLSFTLTPEKLTLGLKRRQLEEKFE